METMSTISLDLDCIATMYSLNAPLTAQVKRDCMGMCCVATCLRNLLTFANVAAGALHVSKPTHWLESRFHFSFADWHDTDRQNFGALRVMNDDLVSAGNGFGCATNMRYEYFTQNYTTARC